MTRARVQALRDKVNSLLVALDMDDTLNGMLPHASVLCILRYTPTGAVHAGRNELDEIVARKEEDGASRPWRYHRHSLAVPPLSTGGAGCTTASRRMCHRLFRQTLLDSNPRWRYHRQGPAVPPPHPDAPTSPEPAVPPPKPAVPPPSPAALKTRASGATASHRRYHRQLGKSHQLNAAVPPLRQRCHRQLAVCAQIGFDAPEYSLSYPFDYISYL